MAKWAMRLANLPRSVRKGAAVSTFLVLAVLVLSGGTLFTASLMHAVVTNLDMPPVMGGKLVLSHADQVVIGVNAAGGKQTFIILPRPTIAHALDHTIEYLRDPADSYIQMDAVDTGLFLQQTVHNWLLGLFAKATRAPAPQQTLTVPLTSGQ